MSQSKQTVCLNMIVRNESRIIERCLNSVRSLIDHWVIVDTGSTDGTQAIIRECLRDLPGELTERPWVDFAHNRSEALELARGKSDYILVMDADEVLVKSDDYARPPLTEDAYYIRIHFGPIVFWRVHLFRTEAGLRYESPIHEYLVLRENATYARLDGVWLDSLRDGWRASQPDVWRRDIEVLLKSHQEDPNNPRTTFYLAQSYASNEEPALALEYYQRYVAVSKWPEERWYALLRIADLKQQLQREWPEVLAAYLEAYQFRPHRAEPLYRIALYYRFQGAFHLAYLFLQQAAAIPYPENDYLFVEEQLHRYLIKMALATCCYHVGQYEAGLRYCDELLGDPRSMPWNTYEQLFLNRQQCAAKLAEIHSTSGNQWPKVKVFVAFRNLGPHLDSSIERLLGQTGVPFEIVFLDLGSVPGSQQQIPTEDPRVRLVHCPDGENIWSLVAGHCDENDIVLLLNGSDWLISEDALAKLQRYFLDPGCLVMYGQFQYADGAPGLARSFTDVETERVLTDDWRCTYPLAVRGSLLQQVVREEPIVPISPAPFADSSGEGFSAEEHVALARRLFAAAGSAGVRFNGVPICVYESEPLSQNGSAPVQSRAPAISQHALPKISCLTVTLNRLVLLKEAIQCYCQQTYPNKELIIVTDGTTRYRQAIDDYVRWLGRDDIRLVCVDEAGQTLGALRNVSLDAVTGNLVCQWDDDDLNHPQRLKRQFEQLSAAKANACCFTDQLQFFFRDRMLYWSNWQNGAEPGTQHMIPGTLMTYFNPRFRYPETTELAAIGADSAMLDQVAAAGTVTPFQGAGFLNIYSYHGRNVFSEAHHRRIAVYGSRSADFVREHESILREALGHYRLPEPYCVATGEGPVIVI